MKIVILDDYEGCFGRSASVRELKQDHKVSIFNTRAENEDELVERLKEAEIIIPIRERTKFTKNVLQRLPNLKLISQTGKGLAHIYLDQSISS